MVALSTLVIAPQWPGLPGVTSFLVYFLLVASNVPEKLQQVIDFSFLVHMTNKHSYNLLKVVYDRCRQLESSESGDIVHEQEIRREIVT